MAIIVLCIHHHEPAPKLSKLFHHGCVEGLAKLLLIQNPCGQDTKEQHRKKRDHLNPKLMDSKHQNEETGTLVEDLLWAIEHETKQRAAAKCDELAKGDTGAQWKLLALVLDRLFALVVLVCFLVLCVTLIYGRY